MMTLRLVRAALLLLIATILPRELSAHEATLGVLEFREVRPGAFVGRWTMEPSIGAARVDLRVPPHCFLRLPEMNCGEKGLVGPITITNLGADMSAVLIKIIPVADQPRSYTISTANPVVSLLGTGAPTLQTWIELARTYVNYGIDHILLGADHLLFVLGLIWIVGGGWRLVKTITAFTVGHSASLAAAAFGLPARYPWAVAFTFGLVHGIGFASALAGLGLERRLLPAALLFFNIGVEIGQLAFVLLVLALIWAHRRLDAVLPRWGNALPAYAIGSVSMFWFLGRL